MPRCSYYLDPFESTGQCPETDGLHLHLGSRWCERHYTAIKAAEVRAITQKANSIAMMRKP